MKTPEDYADIRDGVRSLCAEFPDEYFRKIDAERGYPEAFVNALTKAGWLAALIPQEYGGSGLSLAEASVIMEEINHAGGNSGACHGQMHSSGEEDLYLGLSASEGVNGSGDVAAVYAGLVGMKSGEDPSMNLVTRGDLENSYLWHKVVGDQNTDPTVVGGCQPAASGPSPCSDCISGAPCGAQMPLAGTLDPAAACAIENWVMQGAKND